MSGIFGIFNRNGNSVDKKIANNMLEAMSGWEPDESNLWIDGPIALGHAMLWNTPESKYEHLPLHKDTYILTMDARIDNREELVQKLDLPNLPIGEIGDGEFILAAYHKWGEECPKYLLGDFTFVIWDENKQQLFCARDPLGVKLFHYHLDNELFVFSNDIQGVLSHPGVSENYDDKTIAIFLRDKGVYTSRDTFFEQIKKLPGGTVLIVTAQNIIERSYWQIENSPKIHYDTFEEYVSALKKLLEDAVEVRLRTQYPIVSHLSGGIDCSSIAVLAARNLRQEKKTLHAFNWIDIPEKKDEYEFEAWKFSRRIAEIEDIEHEEFCIDPSFIAKKYDEHDIATKGTMYMWREYYVQKRSKQLGARTILSGWGGDELISNSGYSFHKGLFKEGKYIKAFQSLYLRYKYKKYPGYKFMLGSIYTVVRRYMKGIRKKTIAINKNAVDDYTYLKKEIIETMKKYPFIDITFPIGVHNNQINWFNNGHLQHRIESWALSAFSEKIEYSYPLLDRRIVEFAIGIPEDIYFHKNGHQRYLMRSTINDLLPSDIVWFPKPNETKVNTKYQKQYQESLKYWYEKHKDDDIHLYENTYVKYGKIISMLKKYTSNKINKEPIGKVVTAILLVNLTKRKNFVKI